MIRKTEEVAEECFDVGDVIFVIHKNKITKTVVRQVMIMIKESRHKIEYSTPLNIVDSHTLIKTHIIFKQDDVHDSLEELIKNSKEGFEDA